MTSNIYKLLEEKITSLENYNDKTAIIFENQKISFKKLISNIDRFSNHLLKEKKNLKKPIIAALENSENYIYLLFAASKLNLSLLLINPDSTAEEINNLETESKLIFFDKKNILKAKKNIKKKINIIPIEVFNRQSRQEKKEKYKFKSKNFIINFSSGSTDKPKKIIYSQNLKISRAKQLQESFNINKQDIFINYAPIYHSLGQRLIFSSLLFLNTIVLMRKFNFSEWENSIYKYKANILFPISSHLNLLVKSLNKNKEKYKHVKKIIASSSQVSQKTKQTIIKKYGKIFFETYGAAEIAFASILKPEDHISKKNSVGKVSKGVNIKIIKKDNIDYGEICCNSKFLSYFSKKEKKNKNIFIKEKYFRTGDLGYIDKDGYLYYVSRQKDIIIKSGINIVPKKIEDAILAESLIENCTVIGVKDEIFGETPLAICLLKDDNEKNRNTFELNLRKTLSRTSNPSKIIYTNSLKFLPSGKIDKAYYREKYKKLIFNKGKSKLFV
mgnify:CR=1 FL=1